MKDDRMHELNSILNEAKQYSDDGEYFTDKKIKTITREMMDILHDVQIDYLEEHADAVLKRNGMNGSTVNYASIMLKGIKFESVRKQISQALRKEFGGK
jgi:hypothetical protein